MCGIALAFRPDRDYLADIPRHCESNVRLAPPGTGAKPLCSVRGDILECQ
jgi:hypothetical protein